MNRIAHLLLCLVRLILVVAAPPFAFSLASRGSSRIGPASANTAKPAPLEFPAVSAVDGLQHGAALKAAVDPDLFTATGSGQNSYRRP